MTVAIPIAILMLCAWVIVDTIVQAERNYWERKHRIDRIGRK